MRGLLACARWELLWQWGQFRSGGGGYLFLTIWFPVFSFLLAKDARSEWSIFLGSGLVPLGAVSLLAARAFGWLSGGTFALERSSGRTGWQSVLGRCMVWMPELCGAELFRQLVLWASVERSTAFTEFLRENGVFVFDAAEAVGWMGPAAFLGAVCVTFGLCIGAQTVGLLLKSGKMRHKTKIWDGCAAFLEIVLGIGLLWDFLRFPLAALGAVCAAAGLPLSCWLLEHRAE